MSQGVHFWQGPFFVLLPLSRNRDREVHCRSSPIWPADGSSVCWRHWHRNWFLLIHADSLVASDGQCNSESALFGMTLVQSHLASLWISSSLNQLDLGFKFLWLNVTITLYLGLNGSLSGVINFTLNHMCHMFRLRTSPTTAGQYSWRQWTLVNWLASPLSTFILFSSPFCSLLTHSSPLLSSHSIFHLFTFLLYSFTPLLLSHLLFSPPLCRYSSLPSPVPRCSPRLSLPAPRQSWPRPKFCAIVALATVVAVVQSVATHRPWPCQGSGGDLMPISCPWELPLKWAHKWL